jgi:hypothetical protein
MECVPDQAIVNKHHPCQGIASHIYYKPCFEPEIATIALGDGYPMPLTNDSTALLTFGYPSVRPL